MKNIQELIKKSTAIDFIKVLTVVVCMFYSLDIIAQDANRPLTVDEMGERSQNIQTVSIILGLILIMGFAWYTSFKSSKNNSVKKSETNPGRFMNRHQRLILKTK